tara:strand:+ start:1489 stop:1761 length:273 start_codon:yes stop_codon:yes gene_type:complete
MEVKILEAEKTRIKVEFVGKSHTLVNAIVKELWNDAQTVIAGYNLKHPQVDNPVLILETKSKDPKKVLLSALSCLDKSVKAFATAFKKVK